MIPDEKPTEDTPTLSAVLLLAMGLYTGLLWWFGALSP